MSGQRDSQRAKLYRAENECWPVRTRIKNGEAVPEIPWEDVRAIVGGITTSDWWYQRLGYGKVPEAADRHSVYVGDGRGGTWARAGGYGIKLPRWARQLPVILHELSHVLTGIRYRRVDHAAHGREFAKTFLEMVTRWMGPDEAARLRECFRKNHVHWVEKRKMSEEQRQKLREEFKRRMGR